MRVEEIKRAIVQLPKNELSELMTWLENHRQEVWDKQIENDLESGRLNTVLAEAEAVYEGLSPEEIREVEEIALNRRES